MPPTIIDALVVQLELDTANYKRASKDVDKIDAEAAAKRDRVNKKNDKEERERARLEKQNTLDRKKRTDDLTGTVGNLGRSLAAAFLGFESLSGAAKYFGELNAGQAALGRTATRIGVGADALNIYGKAVELAGGKAEDAQASFAKLSQEFTAKKLRSEIGPLLQLFQQKGVNYEDTKGNLRDIATLFDELAGKMSTMSKEDQANIFAEHGLSQGVIDFLLEEKKLRDEQIATATKYNETTKESVKDNEALVSSFREVGQAVDQAGNKLLKFSTPAIKGTLATMAEVVKTLSFSSDTTPAEAEAEALGTDPYAAAGAAGYTPAAPSGGAVRGTITRPVAAPVVPLTLPPAGSRAARNKNPGNVKAVGNQERDAAGFRVFTTMAEGLEVERGTITRKLLAGFDTIERFVAAYLGTDARKDPNATAAYIKSVSAALGRDPSAKLSLADVTALQNAVTYHESPGSTVAPYNHVGATPGASTRTSNMNSSTDNSRSVVVNAPITVNSSNADPRAVASATVDALNRKATVTQADAGQF